MRSDRLEKLYHVDDSPSGSADHFREGEHLYEVGHRMGVHLDKMGHKKKIYSLKKIKAI